MKALFSLMKIFNDTTSMSIEFLQEEDKILFFDDDGKSYKDYHTIHQKHVFPDEKMQELWDEFFEGLSQFDFQRVGGRLYEGEMCNFGDGWIISNVKGDYLAISG